MESNLKSIRTTNFHIALVIYSLAAGGAERVMANMANYWAEQGYEITLITQSDKQSFYRLVDNVKHISLKSSYKSSHFIFALIRNFKTVLKLRALFKSKGVDLVISFMTTTNVLSIIAARSLDVPVIVSERYNPWKFMPSSIWRRFRKWVYPHANEVVVQSNMSREFFDLFCNKNLVHVIYNPVDFPVDPITEYNRLEPQTILTIGRLKYVKGHDLLIRAFADLSASSWKLCIVGEGEERENLEKLISDLGLQGRVFLPGQSEDVESYYRSASLFVLSSRAEGFPNCLAEAMSYGLPCVSMDCDTGPAILIKDGENGLLVPNKDYNSLSKSLQYLIGSPDLREQLGKSARESMKAFKLSNIMGQWDELIQKTGLK